jgi:hypothetical protein
MPETPIDHEGQDFVAPDETKRIQDPAEAESIARASHFARSSAAEGRQLSKELSEQGFNEAANNINNANVRADRDAEIIESRAQKDFRDGREPERSDDIENAFTNMMEAVAPNTMSKKERTTLEKKEAAEKAKRTARALLGQSPEVDSDQDKKEV